MKITEQIKANPNKTLFSFEILPPLKGFNIESIYESIDPLMEFNPIGINVTYHREEFVYKKRENNYLEKVSIRKRPGTVGICAAIKYKYGISAVPHLICGGFSKEETENALIDLQFLGINSVLALRGDAIKSERSFNPEKNGNKNATELVQQINNLNEGKYLHEEIKNAQATNFEIGVAGYPEKHFEAANLKTDLHYLKAKVDAGAHYIVTQLFYDNEKFFAFVKACRDIGINVPIIPGIKPLTTLKQIKFIPKTFFIDFPEELTDQLIKCETNEEVRKVGINWCIKQCQELIDHNVPVLHFYTMGRSTATREIAKQIFTKETSMVELV